MAIGSLFAIKTLLSIPDTDVSQDPSLAIALAAAEAAAESFCKRSFARAVRTELYDGTGLPELYLRQRPVVCFRLAGTFASAATTITGIGDTTDLMVGMPVVHDDVPAGTTIATIPSSTSVTISAATTAAATASTILFGLEVYADSTAYYGDAPNAFAAGTRLDLGDGYTLKRDGDGTAGTNIASASGVLMRLGGATVGSAADVWGWGWPGVIGGGSLTARRMPIWGETRGGYKVTYTAGYAATDAPADLQQAIHQLAVWVWKFTPTGGLVMGNESKSNTAGSYSYALTALREGPELVEARGILRSYRDVQF